MVANEANIFSFDNFFIFIKNSVIIYPSAVNIFLFYRERNFLASRLSNMFSYMTIIFFKNNYIIIILIISHIKLCLNIILHHPMLINVSFMNIKKYYNSMFKSYSP